MKVTYDSPSYSMVGQPSCIRVCWQKYGRERKSHSGSSVDNSLPKLERRLEIALGHWDEQERLLVMHEKFNELCPLFQYNDHVSTITHSPTMEDVLGE